MTTSGTDTRVEELRAAAAKLRTRIDNACGGAAGELAAMLSPALAEPLAAWLKSAAELARDHKLDPTYDTGHGFRWCLECWNEECEALQHIDKALAVARVINGVATGTKAVA